MHHGTRTLHERCDSADANAKLEIHMIAWVVRMPGVKRSAGEWQAQFVKMQRAGRITAPDDQQ
jgi:hypothetical protein